MVIQDDEEPGHKEGWKRLLTWGETIVSVRDPLNYKGFFAFPLCRCKDRSHFRAGQMGEISVITGIWDLA